MGVGSVPILGKEFALTVTQKDLYEALDMLAKAGLRKAIASPQVGAFFDFRQKALTVFGGIAPDWLEDCMSAALRAKIGCLAPGLGQLPDTFDHSVVEDTHMPGLAKLLAKLFVNAAPAWASALRERAAALKKQEAAKDAANKTEASAIFEKRAATAEGTEKGATPAEGTAATTAGGESAAEATHPLEGDIIMIGGLSKKYGGSEGRVTKVTAKEVVVTITSGIFAGDQGKRFKHDSVIIIKPSALRTSVAAGRKAPNPSAALAPEAAAASAPAGEKAPNPSAALAPEAAAASAPGKAECDAGTELAKLLMEG